MSLLNPGRLRPTRQTGQALLGLLWALSLGAVHDFVWADLRDGLINTRGLSQATRTLVWLGFGLFAVVLGLLLANDLLRASSPLVPLLTTLAGRGQMLPVALLPITLFLLAMAWSFALTGALHSHPALRLGLLLLYLLNAGLHIMSLLSTFGLDSRFGFDDSFSFVASLGQVGLAVGSIGGVALFFLLRWRARPRPALEFACLLLLVAVPFILGQAEEVDNLRTLGIPMGILLLEFYLASLNLLILPLLFFIGIGIADFARQAAGWTTRLATERLPHWAPVLLLAALLAWQLYGAGRLAYSALSSQAALEYAGALLDLLIVGAAWALVRSLSRASPSVEELAGTAARYGLPLIIIYQGGLAIGSLVNAVDLLKLAFLTLALAGAIRQARRARPAPALYLAIFSLLQLASHFKAPGQPLSFLARQGESPVHFWWLLLFTLAGLLLLLRQRLNLERAGQLFFITLIAVLLQQTSFLENPFNPLADGLAISGGVGFLVFGLTWDALTAGAWANESSRGLPRTSRIFLYLGYVLLTVTLVNWALTSHDLNRLWMFTGGIAARGLAVFGRPLLYGIFALTLARLLMKADPEPGLE
jgi:hypothetical protein